ncbi:MAG: hypothetical protein FWG40_07625, partial [Peptococcaceae bacterium]|nr:hypothetical protein [Peptococcaceae bacterium]
LWQCDFQLTLYLPDPLHSGRKRKVKLCLILDDYSRYVVHAQIFWNEKMPVLEETLKKGRPYIDDLVGSSEKELPHYFYEFTSKGANISNSVVYVDSSEAKGQVVWVSEYNQYLDMNTHVEIHISRGNR